MQIRDTFTRLESRNFIVSTVPSYETYILGNDMKYIVPTKEQGGKINWIDPNILNIFGDMEVEDTTTFFTQLYKMKFNSIQKDVITDAKMFEVYRECSIGEALSIAAALIESRMSSEFSQGMHIYLAGDIGGIKHKLTLYYLCEWRLLLSPVYMESLLPMWSRCIIGNPLDPRSNNQGF